MKVRLEIIADTEPGNVFRVIGSANTWEEADEVIMAYRVEHGPLVDVRIVNHGRALKRASTKQNKASESKSGGGTTQIKGLG